MMQARGLSEDAYRAEAAAIGKRINFNRRLLQLLCRTGMVSQLFEMAGLAQACRSWQELETFAQGEGNDPLRLLGETLYARQMMEEEWQTPKGIIATHIRAVRPLDFERWGDRNHATGQLRRCWLRESALPIDVALQEVEAVTGRLIEPDHVCQFIIDHPAGLADVYEYQVLSRLEARCREQFGFVPRWGFISDCSRFAARAVVEEEVPF